MGFIVSKNDTQSVPNDLAGSSGLLNPILLSMFAVRQNQS